MNSVNDDNAETKIEAYQAGEATAETAPPPLTTTRDDHAARNDHAETSARLIPIEQVRSRAAGDGVRQSVHAAADEPALGELADSIRQIGLLQPLIVVAVVAEESQSGDACQYAVVVGERRLQAARRAGLTHVPILVRSYRGDLALQAQLIENLQRADLPLLDEAAALATMVSERGFTVRSLARALGKGKGYIEDRLRVTRLSADLRQMVAARPDTLTHARELEKLADAALRAGLVKEALNGLSLQGLRQRVRRAAAAPDDGSAQKGVSKVSGRPDRGMRSEEEKKEEEVEQPEPVGTGVEVESASKVIGDRSQEGSAAGAGPATDEASDAGDDGSGAEAVGTALDSPHGSVLNGLVLVEGAAAGNEPTPTRPARVAQTHGGQTDVAAAARSLRLQVEQGHIPEAQDDRERLRTELIATVKAVNALLGRLKPLKSSRENEEREEGKAA